MTSSERVKYAGFKSSQGKLRGVAIRSRVIIACARRHASAHQRAAVRGREPRPALLHSFTVALTGIHLLRSGALEMDLVTLARAHGPPEVLELIAWKRSTDEKAPLDPALDAALRDGWGALDDALTAARDSSPLPPEPTNRADCEAWLIETRLSAL